jgi:hypothetical protein
MGLLYLIVSSESALNDSLVSRCFKMQISNRLSLETLKLESVCVDKTLVDQSQRSYILF